MKNQMSSLAHEELNKYPFLVKYAQNGLVNFNALARLVGSRGKLAAVGMELRRYVSKLPKTSIVPRNFSKYKLSLITRTNIHELILNKNLNNRTECLKIVNKISETKYFVSLVEGEKEIVVITDHPFSHLLKDLSSDKIINHITKDLAFISVNFPIEMRETPGIYSLVTSILAQQNVPIHSFHTIGGEILILVKNADLLRTQEILHQVLA